MTEKDIERDVLALQTAVRADDQQVALELGLRLLTGLLLDVRRVADALERWTRDDINLRCQP